MDKRIEQKIKSAVNVLVQYHEYLTRQDLVNIINFVGPLLAEMDINELEDHIEHEEV